MRIAIIFILALTIFGCDWLYGEFQVITIEEFDKLRCEWQDPKVSQWFYTGSEDNFHFLVHRDISGDKHYKIKTSELTIDKTTYVSSNEAKWIKMSWGPKDEMCRQ